MALGNHFLLH